MEDHPDAHSDMQGVSHSEGQPPTFPMARVFIEGMKVLVEIMPREPLPCRDDPELFHPVRRSNPFEEIAKQLCAGCVIREECLAHGIEYDESGIWGGKNSDERDALRSRYKKSKQIQTQPPAQPDHLEQTG